MGGIIDDLTKLLRNLENTQYDNQLNSFLQKYGNIIHQHKYKLLVEPMTDNLVASGIAVKNLVKPLFAIENITNESLKYEHYSSNKEVFINYLAKANTSKSIYSENIFIPICNYLLNLYK